MRPWHRGQLTTSTAKLRASNSAHGHYAPARSGVPLWSLLAGMSWGGTIRDLHTSIATASSVSGLPALRQRLVAGTPTMEVPIPSWLIRVSGRPGG